MSDNQLPPALVVGEIGLIRSLGEAGIPLFVGSYYADNIGLYSRYCSRRVRLSHTSSEQFVRELIEFGRAQKRKMVFFSDDDRAVLTFSQHRDALADYYYFNLPENKTVEDVLDKRRFARVARDLKIPAPLTITPESLDELIIASRDISYPCVIKPASKDQWWHPDFLRLVGPYRKAIRCGNREELLYYYKKVSQIDKNLLIQDYIPGNDAYLYSVNLYLDKQQNDLAHFIGHKLRIYPIHAGVATLVQTITDERMHALAIDIAKKLKITGHLNIQYKLMPGTQELKVIEIHTRNSLWCYLSTGAGLNISAIAYYDMIGMPCPLKSNFETGIRWLDISKDLKALRDYGRNGELTCRDWLRSIRGGRVVHHVLSLKDPMPSIMDSWFIMKRRLQGKISFGAAPPK
jgi:D-aspartate ligase